MNSEYSESLSYGAEKRFLDLEERILKDIVRRIKKTGEITSTADWQLTKYYLLGNSTEQIENEIKKCLDDSYAQTWEAYDNVLNSQYVRYKALYEQVNQEFIPFDKNLELQQLVEGFQRQSNTDLFNITKSLGFMIPDAWTGKLHFTSVAQTYNNILDAAMMDIASGAFDYESTIRKTVTQLTNSGLRTAYYAQTGWSNRIDVAARRAIITGISQLSGQMADMNAEKLGTDHFEIDWHEGARPEHRVWQGKVWTKEQLVTVCGLYTVTGLLGANCYHMYYPFVPGISVRIWTDEWLNSKNKEEDVPKEYGGKQYTAYQATQKQRKMETAMRAQREKITLLKEADIDKEKIIDDQIRYNNQLYEYAKFSNKMGLKQQRQRIYSDMKGRVLPRDNSIVKYQKIRYNKDGNIIATDDWTKKEHVKIPGKYRQNAVIETMEEKSGVKYKNRTIYDRKGHMVKQIHSGNHGNKKIHNYGENGEHVHIYRWEKGRIKKRYTREMNQIERKEHGDLL